MSFIGKSIAFVDLVGLDYTPATPLQRPLGGTESAVCYLAVALAERGHRVTLVNATSTPGLFRGVECRSLRQAFTGDYLNTFDVVVSISCAGQQLRELGVTRPMVLWTGYDTDQPLIQYLADGDERYRWDKFVLVSDWQAKRFIEAFKIAPEQIAVLRNAVAPAFESGVRAQPYFFVEGRPPVLAYSSTPFRGLDVLLRAFPLVRAAIPGCEARIYSGMGIYQVSPFRDQYRSLYQRCQVTQGMRYVGPIGQAPLAQAMREADVFAYPSTFPETSCIVLMEAMASGCLVLSEALGALPETAAQFGLLHRRAADTTIEQFAESYARFVIEAIEDAYRQPDLHAARLDAQQAFAREAYSWSARAAEWERLLQATTQRPARTKAPRRNGPCPCGSGEKFKRCCGAMAT